MRGKTKPAPEAPAEEKSEEVSAEEAPKEPSLEEQLAAAKEEAASWKNRYYEAYADMQNLRKSLEEDHREAIRYRAMGFIENLLPSLQSFRGALVAEPNGEEAKNYKQGFTYVYNQIEDVLKEEGVTPIVPKPGDPFDPKSMSALDLAPYEEGKDGQVAKVYSQGYWLHDRLVAPARVSVYPKKAEEKPPEEAPKSPSEA